MSIKHIDYVYSDWQWVVHKVIIRIVQVRMIFYFEIEKLRGENRTISLRERKNERACDLNISIFRIKLCALHLIYIYVSTIFEHHTHTLSTVPHICDYYYCCCFFAFSCHNRCDSNINTVLLVACEKCII